MTRLEKLIARLDEKTDAVLVTSEKSIRWLTGFNYTDGYVIVTQDKSYLFADFRYIEAAKKEADDQFELVLLKRRSSEQAEEIFKRHQIKRVFYEDRFMTCSSYNMWSLNFPEIVFSPACAMIDQLREYKDKEEIESIISAQRIAEKAFEHILNYISPSRTEIDVALELEFFMRQNGAEAAAFETIAVSGSASSLPHGVPRRCKLERGFLTMDYGALVNGYCSDMTRTVCIGEPDEEMKTVYDTVLAAQLAALDMIRGGVKCFDADKTARDLIAGKGYGECFGHSLGHGVGIFIHEMPNLSTAAGEKRLEPGHVVTVEPGIYIEGRYGVRIEDMVVIAEDGTAENITKASKELIVL